MAFTFRGVDVVEGCWKESGERLGLLNNGSIAGEKRRERILQSSARALGRFALEKVRQIQGDPRSPRCWINGKCPQSPTTLQDLVSSPDYDAQA